MRSDGGGKVSALIDVMREADSVAGFLVVVMHRRPQAHEGRKLIPCRFNGAPGVLIHEGGKLVTALTIAVYEGRIQAIYAVQNPDKLLGLEPGDEGNEFVPNRPITSR
jgi:hypothetical protein